MTLSPLAPNVFIMWAGAIVFIGRTVFVIVERLANKLAEWETRE